MSRLKKTPPPPVPPRAAAKTAAAPRKAPRTKVPPTVESVVARVLTFPPTEKTVPALWREADFADLLARAEAPHLAAALSQLRAERRLVALRHGEAEYFAFAEPLVIALGPAPAADPAGTTTDDLLGVYRRLVRESGGFPDVKISGLARALGPAAASALPERLTALWRTGDATLSLGDWSLASEETRAAAVELDGEKYLLVRFEET